MWKSSALAIVVLAILMAACGGGAASLSPRQTGGASPSATKTGTKLPPTKTVEPTTDTPNPLPAAATAEQPTDTPTVEPSTVVHHYVPDASGAAYQGTGSCWVSSIASGRDDAFRCNCVAVGIQGNILATVLRPPNAGRAISRLPKRSPCAEQLGRLLSNQAITHSGIQARR